MKCPFVRMSKSRTTQMPEPVQAMIYIFELLYSCSRFIFLSTIVHLLNNHEGIHVIVLPKATALYESHHN
mgnify:CR=1 FL=1